MSLPSPSYKDNDITLYQGDALALLPELPQASIQLIIVDPPYMGIKKTYLGKRVEWDRQWPTREAYLAWLRQLAKEWQRVLTPNGSLYCFAAPTMAAHVEVMLEEYFEVIQRITWAKPRYSTKAEMFVKDDLRIFFPVTEAILFCEQAIDPYINVSVNLHQQLYSYGPLAQAISRARMTAGKRGTDIDIALGYVRSKDPHRGTELCRRWEEGSSMPSPEDYCRVLTLCGDQRPYEALRDEYEALRADYEALRRPFTVSPAVPYTDVWDFATVPAARGKHPAEKPLALLRHMIEVSSRPGDLVLDSCAGSGTTLEAARQCGRRAIGIELEDNSITLSIQRLSQQELALADDG